jgi:hypothetical protein
MPGDKSARQLVGAFPSTIPVETRGKWIAKRIAFPFKQKKKDMSALKKDHE